MHASTFRETKYIFCRQTWKELQLITFFPLVDICIRIGDICDQSIKLSEIVRLVNFG